MRTGFPWHTPGNAYPEDVGDRWWPMLYRQVAAVALRLGLTAYQAEAACPFASAADTRLPPLSSLSGYAVCAGVDGSTPLSEYSGVKQLSGAAGDAGPSRLAFFQEMLVSARLGYEKPHPVIFQRMLAAAGRPAQSGSPRDNRGQSLCRYRGRETGRYENRPGAPGRWRSSGRRHHRRFSGPPRLSPDMGEWG